MDRPLLKALYVILISLGLAFVFNFLFFIKFPGISVLIFFGILLIAVFAFGRAEHLHFRTPWWLILPILFFALMPAIRANEFLNFLNISAVLGLSMLLAYDLTGRPAFLMKFLDYIVLVILGPLSMMERGLSTLLLMGKFHSAIKQHDIWLRVLKGVIMAIPLLIVFGILFTHADLAFSRFISSFVHITISEQATHYLVWLAFGFVAALSFLSYIFFYKPLGLGIKDKSEVIVPPGRNTEVLVFLGLIAALFLLFIGFQITYLFGGQTNIINAGFTYAEYARRGFWELLVVAMLSLLVLLLSEKYAGAESKTNKQFLIPALILIAEVMVVIVSAFKRLSLYIDTYSMTLLRFYVAGFIMLLLVLFILLAVKFIKSRPEQFFTFGTLLSVIAFLMIVNIVNPDAFIAQSNLNQFNQTGKLDVLHAGELSADAEGIKVQMYKKLQGDDKETLRTLLDQQKEDLEQNTSWQSANLSRSQALKLLKGL